MYITNIQHILIKINKIAKVAKTIIIIIIQSILLQIQSITIKII